MLTEAELDDIRRRLTDSWNSPFLDTVQQRLDIQLLLREVDNLQTRVATFKSALARRSRQGGSLQ